MFKLKSVSLALMLSVFSAFSFAAVDTTALETSVLADIGTVSAYAFVVLAAYLSLHVGLSLVKKFTQKAT